MERAISRAAISETVVRTLRDRQRKPVHRRIVDADLVDQNARAYFRWGRSEERQQRLWQLLDCEDRLEAGLRYCLRATKSDKNFCELIIRRFLIRRRKRVFFLIDN